MILSKEEMVFPAKGSSSFLFLFSIERDASVNYILVWYKRTIHFVCDKWSLFKGLGHKMHFYVNSHRKLKNVRAS